MHLILPDDNRQAVLMSASSGAGQHIRELTTRVLAPDPGIGLASGHSLRSAIRPVSIWSSGIPEIPVLGGAGLFLPYIHGRISLTALTGSCVLDVGAGAAAGGALDFTSSGTFSRTFREIVGETPSGLPRAACADGGAQLVPDGGHAAGGGGGGSLA